MEIAKVKVKVLVEIPRQQKCEIFKKLNEHWFGSPLIPLHTPDEKIPKPLREAHAEVVRGTMIGVVVSVDEFGNLSVGLT